MTEESKKAAVEMVRKNPTCYLATVDDGTPVLRVMYCPRITDDLTVYFSTSIKSNKVAHIKSNPAVSALFYNDMKVARFTGNAEIVTDQDVKDDLWEDDWKQYWKEGSTDPDYVVLRVPSSSADYIDMRSGSFELDKLV